LVPNSHEYFRQRLVGQFDVAGGLEIALLGGLGQLGGPEEIAANFVKNDNILMWKRVGGKTDTRR
jgi:hypothetical protein